MLIIGGMDGNPCLPLPSHGRDVPLDGGGLLENIQPGFKCAGKLRVWDCHAVGKFRGNVGGDALISCCDSVKILGADLLIGGNLHAAECRHPNLILGWQVGVDFRVATSWVSFTADAMHVSGDAELRRADKLKSMRDFVGGN
jgi:hypothetical protein